MDWAGEEARETRAEDALDEGRFGEKSGKDGKSKIGETLRGVKKPPK
jgi:hypothetical protein